MAFSCIHGGECTGCMDCQEDDNEYECPDCGSELDADHICVECGYGEEEDDT